MLVRTIYYSVNFYVITKKRVKWNYTCWLRRRRSIYLRFKKLTYCTDISRTLFGPSLSISRIVDTRYYILEAILMFEKRGPPRGRPFASRFCRGDRDDLSVTIHTITMHLRTPLLCDMNLSSPPPLSHSRTVGLAGAL